MIEAAAPAWLKVCTTCSRYAKPQGARTSGAALADALESRTIDLIASGCLSLRRVPCLAGCKHPGNVALGASDKIKIRLNGVSAAHADTLGRFVALYVQSKDGAIDDDDWPEGLRALVAIMVAPRTNGAER
jgi:predicted metal-binding protein